MEEIANNNPPERRLAAPPWPWGMVTGFFLVLFIFIGSGGLLLAIFGTPAAPSIPFYIQAGTTLITIILSITETVLLISCIKWVEKRKLEEIALSVGNQSEEPLRNVTCCQILVIFFCLLGINTGLLIVFWSLTLAYSYKNHHFLEGTLWPFLMVDIAIGFLVPVIIALALLPLATMVRHMTYNKLETRKLLHWFMPCLSYEQGNKGSYWVIEDTFYFKIEDKFSSGLNSILIYTMVVLTFMNSWIYFINSTLINQYGVSNCGLLTENMKQYSYCFDIFSDISKGVYVNCSYNFSYDKHLFCFEHISVGRNATLIQTLVICFVLYYITATCISIVFQIVKGLLQYSQIKMWSTLLVLFGAISLILGIAVYAFIFYVHSNLDILGLFQFFTITFDIIVVGVLLKRGHPMLNKDDKDSIVLGLNPPGLSEQGNVELTHFRQDNSLTQMQVAEIPSSTSEIPITTATTTPDPPAEMNINETNNDHITTSSLLSATPPSISESEPVETGNDMSVRYTMTTSRVPAPSVPTAGLGVHTLPRPSVLSLRHPHHQKGRPVSYYRVNSLDKQESDSTRSLYDGFLPVGRKVTIL